MKLLLTIALGVLLVPLVGFAAYNDVTLGASDTLLSVGGVTLTVTAVGGAGASFDSMTMNGSTFDLTMSAGSFLRVTSTDRRVLNVTNKGSVVVTSNCTSSQSEYTLENPANSTSASPTVEVTTSTCTTNSPGGGGSPGSSGGGGGGGGGSTVSSRPQKVYPDGTRVYLDQPGAAATIAALNAKFAPKAKAAAVAQAAPVVPKAAVTAPAAVAAISANITRALSKGVTNPQVRVLQQILNSSSDTRIAESGVGALGNETEYFGPATQRAVQKFQVKHGLAGPGDEGYGLVGPKTRAKLNEVAGQAPAVAAPAAAPAAAPSAVTAVPSGATVTRSLAKGATNADVKVLQQVLNSDSETRIADSGAGSPGSETQFFGAGTERALKKFQEKHGIAGPGEPGYGTVGPKTRAKLNEILSGSSGVSAPVAPAAPAVQSAAPAADASAKAAALQKQIQDAMAQIKLLQEQLKTAQ